MLALADCGADLQYCVSLDQVIWHCNYRTHQLPHHPRLSRYLLGRYLHEMNGPWRTIEATVVCP